MRDIGFNTLNKNNGIIIKGEPRVRFKVSSFEDYHNELYIKHIALSIYHLSCQVGTAGSVKMPRYKTHSTPVDCKAENI